MVQSSLQCYATTLTIKIFQVGGDFCSDGIGKCGRQAMLFNLSFMKSKLRNWLTIHLDLVVRMFAQDHYSMSTFPFGDAIEEW